MTDHPLTFQDITEISKQRLITADLCDDMRSAADWQLEQVMIWLKSQKDDPGPLYYDLSTLESIECSLRKAMRPAQEDL